MQIDMNSSITFIEMAINIRPHGKNTIIIGFHGKDSPNS